MLAVLGNLESEIEHQVDALLGDFLSGREVRMHCRGVDEVTGTLDFCLREVQIRALFVPSTPS